jgi:hypothetical protein
MNNLLESAITAHGGLDRWNQVKSITVDASITGAVWHVKNQGDALKNSGYDRRARRNTGMTGVTSLASAFRSEASGG